jgi:hypothetical protein
MFLSFLITCTIFRLRREAEKALGSCGNENAHVWMQSVAESAYTS